MPAAVASIAIRMPLLCTWYTCCSKTVQPLVLDVLLCIRCLSPSEPAGDDARRQQGRGDVPHLPEPSGCRSAAEAQLHHQLLGPAAGAPQLAQDDCSHSQVRHCHQQRDQHCRCHDACAMRTAWLALQWTLHLGHALQALAAGSALRARPAVGAACGGPDTPKHTAWCRACLCMAPSRSVALHTTCQSVLANQLHQARTCTTRQQD
jgi:hypothetical protein